MNSIHQLWQFPLKDQRELLGHDIGDQHETIVIELDEQSKRCFYNQPYAPLTIRQYFLQRPSIEVFQVIIHSIDDASLNMTWETNKMEIPPHEARQMILAWLQRTNYFLNLKGFEAYCTLFGKATVDYN